MNQLPYARELKGATHKIVAPLATLRGCRSKSRAFGSGYIKVRFSLCAEYRKG